MMPSLSQYVADLMFGFAKSQALPETSQPKPSGANRLGRNRPGPEEEARLGF